MVMERSLQYKTNFPLIFLGKLKRFNTWKVMFHRHQVAPSVANEFPWLTFVEILLYKLNYFC